MIESFFAKYLKKIKGYLFVLTEDSKLEKQGQVKESYDFKWEYVNNSKERNKAWQLLLENRIYNVLLIGLFKNVFEIKS